MKTLFPDLPVTKSPRKLWMERHGVLTHWFENAAPGQKCMAIIPLPEDKAAGRNITDCMAHNCRIYDEGGMIGYGDTLDDALIDLAVKHNLQTWNAE